MRRKILVTLLISFFLLPLEAKNFLPLNAHSAVLVSVASQQILLEKNPDTLCPPASMTKLVAIYTAFQRGLERGISLDQEFIIPWEADFRNAPPQSSLMFLQIGQRVSFRELLMGLMLPSGNDAAMALALVTVGSMEEFVAAMNEEMAKLGFQQCRFVDSSGYSDQNQISPREFAFFCIHLIQKYPEILQWASLPEFVYPQPHNLNGTVALHGSLRQINHNEIVGAFKGADGLKTGYISASGNNVAITAEREGSRFVAVLTGIHHPDRARRSWNRASDAASLLTYAFETFQDYQLTFPHYYDNSGNPMQPLEKIITLNKHHLKDFRLHREEEKIFILQNGVPLKTIFLHRAPMPIGQRKSVYPKPFFKGQHLEFLPFSFYLKKN